MSELFFLVLSWVLMVPFVYSLMSIGFFIYTNKLIAKAGIQGLYKVTLKGGIIAMFIVGLLAAVYLVTYYSYHQ